MKLMSEDYLTLVEALTTPILLLRQNGIILHANSSAIDLLESLGGTRPEAGKSLAPHWITDELNTFRTLATACYKTEKSLLNSLNNHAFIQLGIKQLRLSGDDDPLLVTLNDLSRLHLVEDGLRQLVEGISEATGERFFQFLVLHLIKTLDADFALIGEFADPERTEIQTVAAAADGLLLENFRFPLANTPYEQTLADGLCVYPQGVSQRFPLDELALKMGVEGYIGIPLTSSRKTTLGPLAVFSRRPIAESHLAASILQVFAARAAAELERLLAESTIQKLAYHDTVTGLPNRTLLHDRLQLAINRAERDEQGVAVLFLDLDRFKAVNDSLGHAVGDQLLRLVGNRLLDCVRSSDTVARLGGDEFVVLISAVDNDHTVGSVALKILEQLAIPYQIDSHEIYSSSSIGISLFPRDGVTADELLKNADMAMYQAKEAGRNTYHFFSPELNMRATERLLLESTLRRALERGEFFLAYQPQMDLKTGHIGGIEALLRWRHPDLGIVPPTNFIPIAEETGLIVPLGEWVLNEACQQAVRWQQEGHPPLRIAVNVSARQFRQKNLGAQISRILTETGLDPALLELELTESAIMENPEEAILTLRQLKKMGVTLSIDDFGTGYSSLSHLKHFPIDRLKIDRSFVKHVTSDQNDATIAEAIIALAHSMQLTVIAEGVEHDDQLEFMSLHRCDSMQGYYLSRPVTAPEFSLFMKKLREVDGNAEGLLKDETIVQPG